MNSKQIRKYELIVRLATIEPKDLNLPALLSELCSIDFQTAFDMWEFILAQGSTVDLVRVPFTMFLGVSETKTRQLFCESLPLQKLVYGTTQAATDEPAHSFLVNLILSNKLDTADECLAKLRTNPAIDINIYMRTIVDSVFNIYCARNNVRVPVLNKKQKTILLEHVSKIKGPNKALLTQRLKEL